LRDINSRIIKEASEKRSTLIRKLLDCGFIELEQMVWHGYLTEEYIKKHFALLEAMHDWMKVILHHYIQLM